MALEERDIQGLSERIVKDMKQCMQEGRRFSDSHMRFEGWAVTRQKLESCLNAAMGSGSFNEASESLPDGALELLQSLARESAATGTARETDFGSIYRRRVKEGKGIQEFDAMAFRRTDDRAGMVAELRNRLAGAFGPENSNKFTGLTPARATEIAQSLRKDADKVVTDTELSEAEMQFAASIAEFSKLVPAACKLGGLKGPDGGDVTVPNLQEIARDHMHLTPEKIAVLNRMCAPAFLMTPSVSTISTRDLWTKFLPAFLGKCVQNSDGVEDELIDGCTVADEEVLRCFDEQDAKSGLAGEDKAGGWHGFFVDMHDSSGGDAGTLKDMGDNFPMSNIGKVARIVDPRQYAMMIVAAVMVLRTYNQEAVYLDRHGHTLVGSIDGNELMDKARALVASWGHAMAMPEGPTVQVVSAQESAENVMIRPVVSTEAK